MNCRWVRAVVLVISTFYSVLGWPQRTQPAVHPGQIRGQVRLPNDRPAPVGLAVSLEMRGGGTAQQTQTDSQGKFEFLQVSPAQYEVHVRAFGYQVDPQVVNLMGIPTAYLTFVLKPDPHFKDPEVPPEGPGSQLNAQEAAMPEEARKEYLKAQELLLQSKAAHDSIPHFLKAIELYPSYSDTYILLAMAYIQDSKPKAARSALEKAVEVNPESADAHITLGVLLNQQKDFPAAEKNLSRGLELRPDAPEGQYELAKAYWALGRWQDAQPHAVKAVTLKPDMAPAHVLLGNIALRQRDPQGALKEFQEYLRLEPNGPMAEQVHTIVAKIEKALAAQ